MINNEIKSLDIDTVPPTVSAFGTTSPSGYYGNRSSINIRATMSETVQAGAVFVATLNTGGTVTLASPTQGNVLSGTYVVSIGENTNRLLVSSFDTGTVLDLAGNTMVSTTLPATNLPTGIIVDTVFPTISAFGSITSGGVYRVGNKINIRATMSEPVLAGSNFEATLDTGEVVRLIASAQGTNMSGWYFVVPGDNSSRLNVTSINPVFVKDLAGNLMTSTSFPSFPAGFIIDTVEPTVVAFGSTTLSGTYGVGSAINVRATIVQPVRAGSTLTVTLNTGVSIALTTASVSTVLSGTYTVGAGQNATNLAVTSFSAGGVLDLAGNCLNNTTIPSTNIPTGIVING
jgi:hypothetical protein